MKRASLREANRAAIAECIGADFARAQVSLHLGFFRTVGHAVYCQPTSSDK